MMEEKEQLQYSESAKVEQIKKFLTDFKENSGSYKYLEKIDSLSGSNLMLEYSDLFNYEHETENDFKIWSYFNTNPKEAIELTKKSVKEVYKNKFGSQKTNKLNINILIDKSELEIKVNQAIKHKYINKLVSIEGRIHGESTIQNRIIKGIWLCSNGHETETEDEPSKCNKKDCISKEIILDQEKSEIESFRTYYVKSLEYTEHHSDSLIVEVKGDLADSTKMGDVVKLTGYITLERKQSDKGKKILSILHALNVNKTNEINLEITENDKASFEKLVQEEGFYDKLVNSIAPNIYGSSLLKEAFLLCYIGSSQWDKEQRYWINVLSVGDPATAKSKLAQWAENNLENVQFVSSKAGSAKGLFAGQKEQADGQKVLEVGPMVSLSGRGVLCIDEFARMREIFDIFYSPMETGTFHSATVGGHENLNAQTAIYATGNPFKTNLWDSDRSVIDNLQVFEPSMLSRFDLIIISKDESTSEERKSIAKSILGKNHTQEISNRIIPSETLTKFCRYTKTINPTLTNDIIDLITETFDDIIKQKKVTMKNDEVNNRLVGTLARTTLAIARANLHREATIEDFSKAHNLIKTMYAQRGLQASNANTYIERIGQMIFIILEKSQTGLTDSEIYDSLSARFPEKHDMLLNDLGENGPSRSENKKWRHVMEYVEKSYMIEIENSKPKRLRWKKDQKTLD